MKLGKPMITPCLWFDGQAEEAARFYVSLFKKGAKIHRISRYGKEGFEVHQQPEGKVLTVDFTILGQRFTALNGGPLFKFNEAVSFQILCGTQKEIDHYWDALSADPNAEACGWLKDKFGLSWQVAPAFMAKLLAGKPTPKTERVMKALMAMKKLDIAALKKAYDGK